MAALYGKIYAAALLYLYSRDRLIAVCESLYHAFSSAVCGGTVIFAQMARKAPVLVNVNSFHFTSPLSLTCVLYAEYLKFLFVKTDTSEHKSVASESLD